MEELKLNCIHEMYTCAILEQQIAYSILEDKYLNMQGNVINESSDSRISKAIETIKRWIGKIITFITKTIPNWIKKQAEKIANLFKKRKNATVIDDTKINDNNIKEYVQLCNRYATLSREIEITPDRQKEQKSKELKEYEQKIKAIRDTIEDKSLCDKIMSDAKNGKDIMVKSEQQVRYSGKLYDKETIRTVSGLIRETDIRVGNIIGDFSSNFSRFYDKFDETVLTGYNEDIDEVQKCVDDCKNAMEACINAPLVDVTVNSIDFYKTQVYDLMPPQNNSLNALQTKINELQRSENVNQFFYDIVKIVNKLLSLYESYANAFNKFLTWKTQVDQNFAATAKLISI